MRLLLLSFTATFAHRAYVERIPNGPLFEVLGWPAVGHVAPTPHAAGDAAQSAATAEYAACNQSIPQHEVRCALRRLQWSGATFIRNRFGHDFATEAFTWTASLCRRDSDRDGRSNGEELGDPHCVWVLGATPTVTVPNLLSHPGIPGAQGHADALMTPSRATIAQPRLTVADRAPAAELFYYHFVALPLILALGVLIYACCPQAPAPRWPVIFFEAYLISHVGVFLGNHRWASHHAFRPHASLKWAFCLLTAFGAGGGPLHWAYLHRIHHRTCDQPLLDLQSPAPPRGFLHGRMLWFRTHREHFSMASWVNTEAIVADLMRDEEIPSFGKRSEEHIAVHVAILLALALGFFLYHLHRSWRHRPAPPSPLAPHSPHAPSSPSSPSSPPSRLPRLPVAKLPALRMALLQTAVSLTWYFFTPVCLAFQGWSPLSPPAVRTLHLARLHPLPSIRPPPPQPPTHGSSARSFCHQLSCWSSNLNPTLIPPTLILTLPTSCHAGHRRCPSVG